MASAISFQGLSTNLPTDQLVNAIMQQESLPLQRLQDRQTLNSQRSSVLRTIRTNLLAFNTSLNALATTAMQARTVTSSDANGTYATATASGASVGAYSLVVSQIATAGKLDNTSFAVADPAATKVFNDAVTATASFAIKGTDGVIKTFSLSGASNNLNGLQNAINTSGAGVTATIVNTGTGASPYRLIVTANATGTGTTSGVVTLAETTAGGPLNTLGIAAGTVDNPTTPTTLTGGTASTGAQVAVDANFTLNGVAMTRKTNVVTDAVNGMTLTLKKGDATGTVTTLTVAVDKATITTAAQDVASKFNAAYTAYKNATASGGALVGDSTIRTLFSRIRSTFTAIPAGIAAGSSYNSVAALGFKTGRDGTMSVDSTALQAALDANTPQVQSVLTGTNSSTGSLLQSITSPGSGNIATTLTSIDLRNLNLGRQIAAMQTRLDRRRQSLQAQYSRLEAVVGQLQAAGQSLGGLR